MKKKRVAVIGCTGSIGRQAVSVILRHPDRFEASVLAANSDYDLLARQAALLHPAKTVLRREGDYPVTEGTCFACGEDAFRAACADPDTDIVLNAVTGFAGLAATLAAVNAGKDVALANKESLVCGGNLVMRAAEARGVRILPVDSEHSAVWQALHFDCRTPFRKILLTASGGALRDLPLEELPFVTAEQALRHPNWRMGDKITIDCATMLNKGFEVIEAMHLFHAAQGQIEVLIHRESIVHSLVEFEDGAVIGQLGIPSMELPIQLALTWPERMETGLPRLDLVNAGTLHFEAVEEERYPCFRLALECAEKGGVYPAVLNAAGEVAVRAFLKGKIGYTGIPEVIESVLSAQEYMPADTYEEIAGADLLARERARRFCRE